MLRQNKKGFTLLELLIVIAIIAVLSVILVIVIDPSETLKKARDTQRISDLNTLKTALGIFMTATSTPDLGGSICFTNGGSTAKIGYSLPVAASTCSANIAEGDDAAGTFGTDYCNFATSANYTNVDGTGWIPVDLTAIVGGSPISNLPIDPTNSIATAATPTSTDLVYRYACQNSASSGKPAKAFEMNARLESASYGPGGEDDRSVKDGGDNSNLYEIGSNVKLLGSTGF